MQKKTSYNVVMTGLFIAIGLLLPFFTSHAFGVPGTLLLPMHIPVLLCGLFCGPLYGAASGLIIPVLSSVLTGMPPVFPMLPIMGVQLVAMGFISGMLYRKLKLHIYISLPVAMLAGWVFYGLTFGAIFFANNGQLKAASVWTAITTGLPGMAIQLVLIPIIVKGVERFQKSRSNGGESIDGGKIKQEAVEIILSNEASCVVVKDEKIIHTDSGRGVSPLIRLYDNNPDMLKDAYVLDKIIGKGAAMILVLGGAKRVYGNIMSVSAYEYLKAHGIAAENGSCVEIITARDNKGMCPIEQSVLEISDPQEGLAKIRETIAKLMAG